MRESFFSRGLVVFWNSKWHWLLAVAGLLHAAQAQALFSTTVFSGNFRIPSLELAPDGVLLAFIENRPAGTACDPGCGTPINLQIRRSTDFGRNWTQPIRLFDSADLAYSDPRPLVDWETGKTFIFCARWGANCGQNANCPTWSDVRQDICWRESLDSGKVWSAENFGMKARLGNRTWRSINVTPGRGIQLRWQTSIQGGRNGRLILPILVRDAANALLVGSLFSDDHGIAWNVGDFVPGPGDETDMVELTDGRVLLSTRGGTRTWFLSNDGGITWTRSASAGIAITAVDCSIGRLTAARTGDDRDRLVFSGPIGPGRIDLGIWMSYNEGRTWTAPVKLFTGPTAYSALVRLSDGTIGVLFENLSSTNPINTVIFQNFSQSYIEPVTGIAQNREESILRYRNGEAPSILYRNYRPNTRNRVYDARGKSAKAIKTRF